MYIAACRELENLDLESTKFSSKYFNFRISLDSQTLTCISIIEEGLFTILESCPNIIELDLTGCRSVSVRDRRRFFEVSPGR